MTELELSRKAWTVIKNVGMLGVGIAGLCYNVTGAAYIFAFICWVIGISGFIGLFVPDEEDKVAKSMAKSKFEGRDCGDAFNHTMWILIIMLPVSHGEIFYGLCWFFLWVYSKGKEERIEYYYEEYVSGRMQPEGK